MIIFNTFLDWWDSFQIFYDPNYTNYCTIDQETIKINLNENLEPSTFFSLIRYLWLSLKKPQKLIHRRLDQILSTKRKKTITITIMRTEPVSVSHPFESLDVRQSFQLSEVTPAGPQDEDMNFQYYDFMFCIFCTLIGTLLCAVTLSFCCCFVILSCELRRLWINK